MSETQKAAYKITVEGGATCYLKEMKRGVLERVLSMIAPKGNQEPQYINAGEKILRSCWLDTATVKGEKVESDKAILENDDLLTAAAFQAYELVDIKTAKLEKL